MAVVPPQSMHWKHPLQTAGQAMAEKRQNHHALCRALADFGADAVKQSLRVLQAEALYRSEKYLGIATWLDQLHKHMATATTPCLRANLIWKAVATAPPGFCHVRSTMIGTLLEDIVAGLPFDALKRRFAEKMHPRRGDLIVRSVDLVCKKAEGTGLRKRLQVTRTRETS